MRVIRITGANAVKLEVVCGEQCKPCLAVTANTPKPYLHLQRKNGNKHREQVERIENQNERGYQTKFGQRRHTHHGADRQCCNLARIVLDEGAVNEGGRMIEYVRE